MRLLKDKKQAQGWQDESHNNYIKYAARFGSALESLRLKLANLEQSLDSVNGHPDKQKAVLDTLIAIQNTKEQIRRHQTDLQCCKNMSSAKSQKIPANIEDHNIWNDCWYDGKRKAYVTHNEYFKKIPDIHTTEHQHNYDQEIGDGGIVVREFKVKFLFGYPACKINYKDGSSVWFLLPTLTDDMLTKEIVKARLMPESQENAIAYETQSEPWLEFGNGLKLTEKEYELGIDLGVYSPIPLSALKAASNRN
jgi:hypothetical protein